MVVICLAKLPIKGGNDYELCEQLNDSIVYNLLLTVVIVYLILQ